MDAAPFSKIDLLVVDSLTAVDLALPVLAPSTQDANLPSESILKERLVEWERKYRAANSTNTLKAVRADWQVFMAWCSSTSVRPLPLSGPSLLKFVTAQVKLGKRRSTLNRYVNTIRLVHEGAMLPDPTSYPDWKLEWRAIVKTLVAKGGNAPRQTQPLRSEHVDVIHAALGDSLLDLRDAALLGLASDTLCRESELVSLKIEDFSSTGDSWSVDVRISKTDQEGLGDARYCSNETKALIDRWCQAAGISRGHLFVAIGRSRKLPPIAGDRQPLAAPEVARIIRRRAVQANLPHAHRMTGHSGRVGSAVELIENGATPVEVQFSGGWKSQRMVLHYGKRAMAGRNAMSDLRKKKKKPEVD